MSKFRGVKTDNGAKEIKVRLREDVLKCFSRASDAKVLDVFCGHGQMYNRVWGRAGKYTGIDKKKFFDERHTICGDAEKIVRKVDISEYNIFDIDSYGSPYSVLAHIAKNVNNRKTNYFVLTDGVNMDLKLGRICKGIRDILGIKHHILKKAHLWQDLLIRDIVSEIATSCGGDVKFFKIAKQRTGAMMRYYAFAVKPCVVKHAKGCDILSVNKAEGHV